MDILILREVCNFTLLAQANNTARAAEKVHMTTSFLGESTAILEDQIGYTLFTRKGNNISLNRAERELYQKLFPVYQCLSAIDDEIHNASRRSREIVIGTDNTYPMITSDQLISLGDKYDGVMAQAVELSEGGTTDNLFDHKLDLTISPQHVSPHVQELENLAVSELPPLRLGFLVSRHYEEKQPQGLLHELPWLQMCSQNRVNSEAMLDAYMRPYGINLTITCHPYSFMAKVSAVEHGQFSTVISYFTWQLVDPSTLKCFDAPGSPIYIQEFLCSLKSHRYTATMFQHIIEDRDDSAG